MTSLTIPKSSNKNRFTFKPEIDNVCTALLQEQSLSASQHESVAGIQNFGNRVGFITKKQIKLIGSCSKTYLQDGQYVQHNWW